MRKWERLAALTLLTAGGVFAAAPAQAAETIRYSYDVHGRLVKVARTGTVNNGIATDYRFDKADNRTAKTTTGSAN